MRDGVIVRPVGPNGWPDVERLFGVNGACGGCWCVYPRLRGRDFEAGKGEGNRQALEALVRDGAQPGLIAYRAGEPAAWIAVGPREAYGRLSRSPVCQPVDELADVWAVTCFFVPRAHRRQGLSRELLDGAVAHAFASGAAAVEGYPVDAEGATPDVFAWWGTASTFRAAGFTEIARRSPTRPIMRLLRP